MANMGQVRSIRRALRRFRLRQHGAAFAAPTAAFAVSLATSVAVFGDPVDPAVAFADTFGTPIEIVSLPDPEAG